MAPHCHHRLWPLGVEESDEYWPDYTGLVNLPAAGACSGEDDEVPAARCERPANKL